MKLWDIVKNVGGEIVKSVVPGGGLLVEAVNAFLPDDKKVAKDATGDQLRTAVESLPAKQRAELMEKEFDVDIVQIKESNQTVRTMLEQDAKNPHTTRPYIAKHAFHTIALSIIIAVLMWAYAVGTGDTKLVKAIQDGWPFVLGVNGTLATLLLAYFGILKQEHRDRLTAANGDSTPRGVAGILSTLLKK